MPTRYGGAAARSSVPVSEGGGYHGLGTVGAVSPTERGRVGSGYGERTSSRTGRRTFHAGWDFVAPRGTPVYAADSGSVVLVARERPGGPYRGYGNAVVVHHADDETYVLYAHLQRVDVLEGQSVERGMQVGVAGNTTNGRFPRMPPHLHVEVRRPRENGSIPFPGAYGRHNLDPKDWFERRGLVIGNRWARPPGTLVPAGEEVSGLAHGPGPFCPHGWMGGPCPRCRRGLGEDRVPEWWETVFTERAPEGSSYEPHQAASSPLWDWSGLIAGTVLFNGVYFAVTGELPIIGRRGRGR